jgi:catechol 2,3-dioxygenase-like lactoylglutathione lyase family enzyme
MHNVPKTRFECANPILKVADMARSVRYYVEVLGFTNAEWGGNDFTFVTRDSAGIYLCKSEEAPSEAWVWIGVEDVRTLHEEYKAEGLRSSNCLRTSLGHVKWRSAILTVTFFDSVRNLRKSEPTRVTRLVDEDRNFRLLYR